MGEIAHGKRRRASVLQTQNYSFKVLIYLAYIPFDSFLSFLFEDEKFLSGGECNNPSFSYLFYLVI
jgi:hypothetical protein